MSVTMHTSANNIETTRRIAPFSLPEDWQLGRAERTGYAIDYSYSPDKDDAISASQEDGRDILHVSIADVGSFLHDSADMQQIAERRLCTVYGLRCVLRPMLPQIVSEQTLSLQHLEPRPVVTLSMDIASVKKDSMPKIECEVMHALDVEPREINRAFRYGVKDEGLRRIGTIADHLRTARQGQVQADIETEIFEIYGYQADYRDTPAYKIVEESMVLANTCIAHYMAEHAIPGLFRVQPGNRRRAIYSVDPDAHTALNTPLYAHFTSPLRRFPDFLNHLNVVAHLEGREPVYSSDYIRAIMGRINSHMDLGKRYAPPLPPKADVIVRAINEERVQPSALASAVFGDVRGSDEAIQAACQSAMEYLESHPKTLYGTVVHAAEKGLLVAQTKDNRTIYTHETSGKTLNVGVAKSTFSRSRAMKFLSAVTGYEVMPIDQAAQGAQLAYGTKLFARLRTQGVLDYHREADQHGVTVTAFIDGEMYSTRSTNANRHEAYKEATAAIYKHADLATRNLADASSTTNGRTPVDTLESLAAAHYNPEPTYTITHHATPAPHVVCLLETFSQDNMPITVTVKAMGKRRAKQIAAQKALEAMTQDDENAT